MSSSSSSCHSSKMNSFKGITRPDPMIILILHFHNTTMSLNPFSINHNSTNQNLFAPKYNKIHTLILVAAM